MVDIKDNYNLLKVNQKEDIIKEKEENISKDHFIKD